MGLLGHIAPLRGILGDLSVEAFQLGVKGGLQLKHSPGKSLQDCFHPQYEVPGAAAMG